VERAAEREKARGAQQETKEYVDGYLHMAKQDVRIPSSVSCNSLGWDLTSHTVILSGSDRLQNFKF
jgi:hypothetical protein